MLATQHIMHVSDTYITVFLIIMDQNNGVTKEKIFSHLMKIVNS